MADELDPSLRPRTIEHRLEKVEKEQLALRSRVATLEAQMRQLLDIQYGSRLDKLDREMAILNEKVATLEQQVHQLMTRPVGINVTPSNPAPRATP